MHPAPGARFGPYLLGEVLGTGGMGQVFRAAHVETGAEHAVKCVLGLASAEEQLRFVREAEALARVDGHPNVLRVHAAGVERGVSWLAMELATGGSLADRLRGGPLAPAAAAMLVHDLARGLAHVHARGVLHRDLKPENVLFAADGAPKLADFGLACLRDAPSLTRTGCLLGTPAYMPPEQARGERDLDERADIYSLGAVLYCALTGAPPVPAGNPIVMLGRVVNGDIPSPRTLQPRIPPWLEKVVLRAMARERASRYPTAAAFADALVRRPGSGGARGGLALAAALVVVVGVLAGRASLSTGRDAGPEDRESSAPAAERSPADPGSPRAAPPPTLADVEALLDAGQAEDALAAIAEVSHASLAQRCFLIAEAHLARDRFAEARSALQATEETALIERTVVQAALATPGPGALDNTVPFFMLLKKPPEPAQGTARLRAALARAEQRLLCRPHVLAAFDSTFFLDALVAARDSAPRSPFASDLQALWLVTKRGPDADAASRALRDDAPEHVRFFVRAAQVVTSPAKARRSLVDEAPDGLAAGPPPFVAHWGAQGKYLGDLLRDYAERRTKDLLDLAFTRRDQTINRAAALAGARAWQPIVRRESLVAAQVALFEGALEDARGALEGCPPLLGALDLHLAELLLQEGAIGAAREELDRLIADSDRDLRVTPHGNDREVLVLVDFWTARAVARALEGDLAGASADLARGRALADGGFHARLPWRSPDATEAVIERIRAGDERWRGRAPPPSAW